MLERLKNKKGCRLKFFNIAFFALIMGFGGFSIATHKLENVYKTNTEIGIGLLYLSLILFLVVGILYILKIILNFEDVKNDFNHNVKSNFFPGIGKILLIFSIGFLEINHNFSYILWIIGVIWQFIFTVIIFRRWIVKKFEIHELNPLWFLPIVGNLLTPIAGVRLGFLELSWFLFSIGIIMWFVLFTIIMNRIIFHNNLSDKLIPTLIILIAPPCVALLSISNLYNGEILEIGKIFYYFALFMFIIIFSKINIFYKLKFYMSWWAYSFPIAILTTSTIFLYSKTNYLFLGILGIIFYILLVIIMIILIYKTIIGARKKELCIEE